MIEFLIFLGIPLGFLCWWYESLMLSACAERLSTSEGDP